MKKKPTKQIRISEEWHHILQINAGEKHIPMSKFVDMICRQYFGSKRYLFTMTENNDYFKKLQERRLRREENPTKTDSSEAQSVQKEPLPGAQTTQNHAEL